MQRGSVGYREKQGKEGHFEANDIDSLVYQNYC